MLALPVTVLNVADEPAARQITSRMLRRAGCRVIEAASLAEAIGRIGHGPDVVVLHRKADATGLQAFLTAVRNTAAPRNLPILHLVAAEEGSEPADNCRPPSGNDRRLQWPARAEVLIAAIENLAHAGSPQFGPDGSTADAQDAGVATAHDECESRLHLFEQAIDSLDSGVMITDALAADHPIVHVNAAFERITGYSPAEALGKNGRMLISDEVDQIELDTLRHALRERDSSRTLLRLCRKDGSLFWSDCAVRPVASVGKSVTHYVSILTDVTDKVGSERLLAHLSTHDPLTGLANRTLLGDRIRQAITQVDRFGTQAAILIIDLDRFQQVNDAIGPAGGDIVLQEVARRLEHTVREGDTVARFGGDEFVVMLGGLKGDGDALIVVAKVLAALSRPVLLESRTLVCTPSIGVSLCPLHARDADELLRLAGVAMDEVKAGGRCGYRVYDASMEDHSSLRLYDLDAALRTALEHDEFELHYQPKVDLGSGKAVGVEALIRWRHPQRGLVSPAEFIPRAEETGLILDIGEWALREACRQARQWQDQRLPPVRVAVNLSARQLRNENLPDVVMSALADAGVTTQWLELELTESTVMQNLDAAGQSLRRLKAIGVALSMDDFGTGYSSLGYLRRFPFDTLKIDRSFVENITTEPEDALIAVAIIAMAHSLRLRVVAEGVETEAQMRYLRAHHCDEIQGYYFCKPLPAAETTQFLHQQPRLPAAENGDSVRTLLLVDDELGVLNALKRLLRSSGYHILTANSGAQGLEVLAMNDVQVVISDQRMPGMTGSEFLARVKDLYPATVRMVLSGYSDLDSITDAVNRGAVYKYLSKPWNDDVVREVVREAFIRHSRQPKAGSRRT